MKILELPVPLRINCECGCSFEFDTDDLLVNSMFIDKLEVKNIKIFCPFCQKVHLLKRININHGEQDNEC